MQRRFEYCVPKVAQVVPTGPDWLHEIKYDGYRGRIERDGDRARLLSKSGLDWAWRYPLIVETALKLRSKHFTIDGEIVVLDESGVSDFDALHANRNNAAARFYAFDCMALAGDDLRELPLFERKDRLARLMRNEAAGIFVATYESGEIGPDLFKAACKMGLEGIVSKHRERRYRPRTCDWRKVKNRAHPAFSREF
ncbi:bifunctional non-homologous end joining protein LigD [Bradyrhizobium japonicum]|jgi:ATP-dependent DNA ligase|uniref:ATP dependent DNA ligase-like protein n=1 Tax=Bradyrhizobium huanghuaihaiense TaxID=990078 RepID=A0A562QTI2_9BRAD|nr:MULTISPECIES: DNA ligase [Bradyrhizobium]MBR0884264.1 DNA ligase [Bradyrhizobium liaoningense]WLB95685.1 DNA ligase [Bradyrhizobium japonicum USDA 123]MBR1004352.1 DNA ligase [Bradyrhizobium liaoningense]MBR1069832.1 DNA ligase [Bradyrhizobium liaoningense]PDT56278.1 DNA ligase [Bradyrhizobium diazoefficiens]